MLRKSARNAGAFLEGRLKLTLNMEKTHITHVNDGFVFLGHRIIRKRGANGRMSVVTTIPKEKAKAFVRRLTETLSGNHSVGTVDMIGSLNRQLAGWAAFYKFTDFTACIFRRIDHVVFWKMAHWLAQKYRSRIKPLMRNWYRAPEPGKAKTWLVYGRNERGEPCRQSAAPTGIKPKGAVPVAKSGRQSIHLPERDPQHRHFKTIMMLLWPWAKLEWRAVCAERCTYGSGRRSAFALLTPPATWQGFVYVAFIIDAFARYYRRLARPTAHAGFVLDALDQALYQRRPVKGAGLIHHSDRGSQYVSIKYTERLLEAGLEPSVGSVGDSYDNALAETINGLYKAELIHRRGPWRSLEAVEYATLEWVDWFNNRRIFEPIGNIPPAEAEENYYAAITPTKMAA